MDKMNRMPIISNRELEPEELQQIQWIMEESGCPNESLRNTIEDYISIDDQIVIGDRDGEFIYEVEY